MLTWHPESQRVGSTDASTQDRETNTDWAMPPGLPVIVSEFIGSRDGAELREKDSTHLANRADKEPETLRESSHNVAEGGTKKSRSQGSGWKLHTSSTPASQGSSPKPRLVCEGKWEGRLRSQQKHEIAATEDR